MVHGKVALLLAAACAGAPRGPADVNAVPASGRPQEPAMAVLPQGTTAHQEFGPEVLLPDPALGDEVVASVGGSTLRRSHAFARLLTADPRTALNAVDVLVFDVLVAGHAREFQIRVDPAKVRERAGKEEAQVRAQVKAELGEGLQFEDYVWRTFGMKIEDWRRTGELRVAQRLYHGYVIRYLALREERVTVRYIVHQDQGVLEGLAQRVKEGADFATLALRHSEDTLRRDGGLLPPFGRGFPHPAAEIAFTLQPGQLSPVVTRDTQNGPRHFLVYCLERRSGRDVKFADVQAEVDAELLNKPLSPIETNAYALRWRAAMERKDAPPQEKHDTSPSGR